MSDEIVLLLSEVGLTRNEALAYLALLEDSDEEGLTGYEVAARSGIPRSAVYTVMRKLEGSRAAFATGEKPARYRATDPRSLLGDMSRSFQGRLETLEERLQRYPRRAAPEPIWTYLRYEEVLDRAAAMIRGAQDSIYLSTWSREFVLLQEALEASRQRAISTVVYGNDPLPTASDDLTAWTTAAGPLGARAAWAHKLLVVVDRKHALIGGSEPEADNHAVYTSNPSLVDLATNHIILDITLLAQRTGRDCSAVVAPMMRPQLPS